MLFALAVSTASMAAGLTQPSVARGQWIHDVAYMHCHETLVYTRATRRVDSFEMLCQEVYWMNPNLSPAERADVVEYLNRAFYWFQGDLNASKQCRVER